MAGTATDERLASEYETLTRACGVLDRSERGKLALAGADAADFLNGQVTNDVLALGEGQGCYAAFLTHKGKMLGDLRVVRIGGELLLDTERVALQALFEMIRRYKVGYAVELHKRTLERSLLSLIGPRAADVLTETAGQPLTLPDQEHCAQATMIGGTAALAIRTDSGVDVLCSSEAHESILAALVAHGAQPVSEASAEVLRLEHGRPRYGVELDDTVIPQEAGLNERAVSFTKGCYVGQETVARLYYRGKPNRHLRGLTLERPAEPRAELRLGERVVGHLASIAVSPRLGPIGLALVRREAEPGSALTAGAEGIAATVVGLPFPT